MYHRRRNSHPSTILVTAAFALIATHCAGPTDAQIIGATSSGGQGNAAGSGTGGAAGMATSASEGAGGNPAVTVGTGGQGAVGGVGGGGACTAGQGQLWNTTYGFTPSCLDCIETECATVLKAVCLDFTPECLAFWNCA